MLAKPECPTWLGMLPEGSLAPLPSFSELRDLFLLEAFSHPPEMLTCPEVVNCCSASMEINAEVTLGGLQMQMGR